MSEPENFLARWSRRKQEAEHTAEPPNDALREKNMEEAVATEGSAAEAKSVETKEPEFDLSSLPSIDSIGAGTDIRAFLQKGVPLELSRAALRRAWVSDPAIRDFIEVAENQWDFATGSDIPGFGPLEASDDVRRMVAEMFQARPDASVIESAPTENSVQESFGEQNSQGVTQHAALQQSEPQNSPEASSVSDEAVVHRKEENTATQQDPQHPEKDTQHPESGLPTKRIHGGALPQ
jgi:hypothetical protein